MNDLLPATLTMPRTLCAAPLQSKYKPHGYCDLHEMSESQGFRVARPGHLQLGRRAVFRGTEPGAGGSRSTFSNRGTGPPVRSAIQRANAAG
jgi:hypothetical protein